MLANALILLFTGAGLAALATLTVSYSRAFAAIGDLRAAAKLDDQPMLASIRIIDHARNAGLMPNRLRLVSSQVRPVMATHSDELRAAA